MGAPLIQRKHGAGSRGAHHPAEEDADDDAAAASGGDAEMEDPEVEDRDAGVGVLAPGRARARAAAAAQDGQPARAVVSRGGGAAGSGGGGEAGAKLAEEPAGFEEVPLQRNGRGGGGAGVDDDSDSEGSDAGLAEMDPNSRAEVRAAAGLSTSCCVALNRLSRPVRQARSQPRTRTPCRALLGLA